MATATVLYPQGAKFNMEYYQKTHMPLVQEKWGPLGLKSWKIVQLKEDAPFCVQAVLEWEHIDAFQAAVKHEAAQTVLGDIPNFTDKNPTIIAGEVVLSS